MKSLEEIQKRMEEIRDLIFAGKITEKLLKEFENLILLEKSYNG
jgi:hypothetical protein